jgi:hypothetical protein
MCEPVSAPPDRFFWGPMTTPERPESYLILSLAPNWRRDIEDVRLGTVVVFRVNNGLR